jgi:uncharacterized protein (TIGR02001 family)
MKSVILGGVMGATLLASGASMAEIAMNIGATNNYIWRGVTQTADLAAVSGGVDYSNDAGVYLGTWASNLASNQYELDIYGGYTGTAGDFSYDLGFIKYMYPVDPAVGPANELDFLELKATASFGPAMLYVAKTIQTEDSSLDADGLYVMLTASTEIEKDYTASITIGSFTGDDIKAAVGDEYKHVAVKLSKDEFSFAIEKNDLGKDATVGSGDPRVVVSWVKSF